MKKEREKVRERGRDREREIEREREKNRFAGRAPFSFIAPSLPSLIEVAAFMGEGLPA